MSVLPQKRRWRPTRCGIAAIAAVILIGAWILFWRNTTNEFDRWTGEMRQKGERFTIAELELGRVVDTNNCMIAVESAASLLKRTASQRDGRSETVADPSPGYEQVRWRQAQLESYDGWMTTWESFGREMAALHSSFRQVHEALLEPTYDPGWDYNQIYKAGLLDNPVAKRLVAQALANAAIYDLHRQDHASAKEHLKALIRLADVYRDARQVLSQMVRFALIGLASEVAWQLLQAPGLSDSDLREIQQLWDGLQLLPDMIRALEMERAVGLAEFKEAAAMIRLNGIWNRPPEGITARLEQFVLAPAYQAFWSNDDKLLFASTYQSLIETFRSLAKERSYYRVKAACERNFERFQDSISGASKIRFPISSIVMPNISRLPTQVIKTQTRHQLTAAALGLKRFEMKRGNFPESLSELYPQYIASIPVDFWDGMPLRYRKNGDGSFMLYSCGEDFQDDGGDPVKDMAWERPMPVGENSITE